MAKKPFLKKKTAVEKVLDDAVQGIKKLESMPDEKAPAVSFQDQDAAKYSKHAKFNKFKKGVN